MAGQVPAPQKEPVLFQPGGRLFLIFLSVISLGYFSGVLVASLRRAQNTTGYFVMLILGGWAIYAFNWSSRSAVIWAGAILVNACFTRAKVPAAVELSISYQLEKGVDMSSPFTLEAADGSGTTFQYFMRAKNQVAAIMQAQGQRSESLRNFYEYMQQYQNDFPQIEPGVDPKAEITLFTSDDCILSEPRKGPTVTERDTSTGIRPFIGTKVGPFLVGGAGPQKSHSTAVTTPGQDIVQPVDRGQLVVTTRSISFVGEKYTRHSDFKTIIASDGEVNQLTISDSKRSTVWTISFSEMAHMWIATALIDAATSLSDRRLDTSAKATFEEVQQAIQRQRDGFNQQLTEAYEQAYAEYEAANDQLREYHRVYPKHVSDPGPRKPMNEQSALSS